MAYLRLSAGIGAGLVFDGELFRGAGGIAGEVGHVMVDPNGQMCRCGNRGCLETLVAPPALCELLRRSHGPLTITELLSRAEDGDAGCQRALADAGQVAGRALADLCNYLNPDLIVIGGELSPAGELILAPMRESVRRYAIGAAADGVQVVAGTLGERAELLGSLALAAQASKEPLAVPLSEMSHLIGGGGG
jgi:predicted NBD/HSP70 family sugar kinase